MTITILDSLGAPHEVFTLNDIADLIGSGATPDADTVTAILKDILEMLGTDASEIFGTLDTVVSRPGFPGSLLARMFDLQEGMRTPVKLPTVILTPHTAAVVSGNILVDTQEVPLTFRVVEGTNENHSFTLLDESNQRIAMDVLFLDNNASIGAEGSAVNIAAGAVARGIVWKHSVGTADWTNLGGVAFASIPNIGGMMQALAGISSIWVAIIARGGGTFGASSLRMKLGQINYQ